MRASAITPHCRHPGSDPDRGVPPRLHLRAIHHMRSTTHQNGATRRSATARSRAAPYRPGTHRAGHRDEHLARESLRTSSRAGVGSNAQRQSWGGQVAGASRGSVKHGAPWRGEVPSSGTSILRWWAASPRGVSVEVVATKEGVTGLFASSCGVIRTFGRLPRSPSVSIGRESGRNREGRPSERAPFGRLRSGQPLPAPAIESRRSSSGGPHPLCENISILLNRS
jgi:hypothetical protein